MPLHIGSKGCYYAFQNANGTPNNIVANPGTTLTVGTNDSGPILLNALGYTQWHIQPLGTWGQGTGQVMCYVLGTTDQYTSGYYAPTPTSPSNSYVAPTQSNWFPLVAQSVETSGDVFTWNNPLYGNNAAALTTLQSIFTDGTIVTDSLNVKLHGLTAIRIIVVTANGSGGTNTNPNCNVGIFVVE